MPLNLTKVYEKVNNVKRNLFYKEGTFATFMLNSKILLEVENGFHIRRNPSSNLTLGIEYFEGSISTTDSTIDLEKIIPISNIVVFGNNKYALTQYTRPRDETLLWKLRLESWSKKHES